jgi:hypothetical protein
MIMDEAEFGSRMMAGRSNSGSPRGPGLNHSTIVTRRAQGMPKATLGRSSLIFFPSEIRSLESG